MGGLDGWVGWVGWMGGLDGWVAWGVAELVSNCMKAGTDL